MHSTPKRRRDDDEEDEASVQRQRNVDDEGAYSEDVRSERSDVFCSQMDNPTPMAQRGMYRGQKQIQDRVHGQVTLDRLLLEVMDTPDFQRLDNIKQLGGCSYVYPSATHTRKEHSIGVCHLAGLMVKHLRKEQPLLGIDDDDELCVKLAGLVHDIGHGPFSHMFEEFVRGAGKAAKASLAEENRLLDDRERKELLEAMRRHGLVRYGTPYATATSNWSAVREAHVEFAARSDQELHENYRVEYKLKYSHEEMSEVLLRHLIDQNGIDLEQHFEGAGDADEQLNFVVLLIRGLDDDKPWPANVGRNEQKRFLLDIVNNMRNGIDVDKLDYLVRDAMSAFGSSKPPVFDIYRMIHSSRVLRRPGRACGEVCFQMKVMLDVNEVYNMRTRLHQFVYQHRIANVAEGMITDLLHSATTFQFRGADDQITTLADAVHNPASFVALTDSVLDMIATSCQDGLEKARLLMRRLKSRDFYRTVGDKIKLRTLPQCLGCGSDTEFKAKWCKDCGFQLFGKSRKKAVIQRKGREQAPHKTSASGQSCMGTPASSQTSASADKDDEYDEEWAAPDYALEEAQAKEEILDFCEADLTEEEKEQVFVHVVDIAHGKKTTVPDPYDSKRKWKTYDPLACVGFFNPKEEAADSTEPVACRHGREQIPGLFLPAAQHVRTLYCYLKASKSPTDEVERERAEVLQGRVEAALDEWKKDRKVGAQLGTSNATPSRCSSQHGTPRSSRSEASRSEAHARMQPRALSRTLTPVAE